MAFNNGLERKHFDAKQKALRVEYERLGMSEEQIQTLYDYDLAAFNSDRKYITHTQTLCENPFPEDGDDGDEAKSPIFERFLRELSTNIGSISELSRYGWTDDIDNPILAENLKKLSPDDLELLTMLVFDGYSQDEIAAARSVTQQAISKKINRIKKYLNKGL